MPPAGGEFAWGNIDFDTEGYKEDFIENVVLPLHDVIQQLELPPWDDYKAQVVDTSQELYQATRSLLELIYVTLRPVVILIGIMTNYLARYTQHMTIKFVEFQRSLDQSVLVLEAVSIAALIGMYLLRRFIQRRRYIPRLKNYLTGKKQKALQKYNRFIARIAETSTILALVIPHIFFWFLVALIYSSRWGRLALRLFSDKLPIRELITLYIPVMKTIILIATFHRQNSLQPKPEFKPVTTTVARQPMVQIGNSATPVRPKSAVSSLIAKYSSINTSRSIDSCESVDTMATASSISSRLSTSDEADQETLREEMSDILKYWVVYSFTVAIALFTSKIPFMSRLLAPLSVVVSDDILSHDTSFVRKGASVIMSCWSLRGVFMNDLRFVALVWAWLFTAIAKAQKHTTNKSTSSKKKSEVPVWYSASPIDYIYHRIVSALQLFDASSTAAHSMSHILGQKLDALLSLVVLVKLIKPSTKEVFVRLCKEGNNYVPCAMTLFMPGFFTYLGGIYASLIVASGYTIQVLNKLKRENKMKAFERNKRQQNPPLFELDSCIVQHLRYYIVLHFLHRTLVTAFWDRAIVATPLFRFVLYWIPFQSHLGVLFLLWLQVPLFNGSESIYHALESELVALTLVDKRYTNLAYDDSKEIGSVTARLLNRALSSIPVAADNGPPDIKNEMKMEKTAPFFEAAD